jgi:nicotinamide mononucleotide transporter
MILLSVFDTFWSNLMNTSWLEFMAVVFGLLSVWYAKQEKILVYPTGIISVVIYVYICFNYKLYADAGINFFYFVMSVYGWYSWSKKGESPGLQITTATKRDWLIAIVLFILSLLMILILLKYFKQDDVEYWLTRVPYIDTFTTAVFIVGMWFMAIKKIENWIFWIIGDAVSVPLYAYKGLIFTSFQFIVFLALGFAGYIAWKKKLRISNASSLS